MLRNATDIRSALGTDYRYLKQTYDLKDDERAKTVREAKKLTYDRCYVCGRHPADKDSRVSRLERAHISPLAECAVTTDENLVLLCRAAKGHPKGCHALFDEGFCSMNRIARCNKTPGTHVDLRMAMLEAHRVAERRGNEPSAAHIRANLNSSISALREAQSNASEPIEWNRLQIRVAELTRRQAKKKALANALIEIDKVDYIVLDDAVDKSRHFYERGYINFLSGNMAAAHTDFNAGRNLLWADQDDPRHMWRWAAHTALMAQVAHCGHLSETTKAQSFAIARKELLKALRKACAAEGALQASQSNEARLARGWVLNCMSHLVRLGLAMNEPAAAMYWWRRAYSSWADANMDDGWEIAARGALLSINGRLLLGGGTCNEARAAMPVLVRSLITYLGARKQQPEGIRDLLDAIAAATRTLGNITLSNRIKRISDLCVDFSSWENPYGPSPEVGGPS